MTETLGDGPTVISAQTPSVEEKIVKRKTIVCEARVDPTLIKLACEKLKKQLFTKFAFYWFQPKLEEIEFVSLEKYYEPYIVISGKYFVLRLHGGERLINEAKASLILDKNGRDYDGSNIPYASPEKNPEIVIKECGIEELAENADVDFIRERIAKRPKDVFRIVEEIFEVTERTVIYCPRYKLLFKWVKTGEERALVLDAVTAERVKQL